MKLSTKTSVLLTGSLLLPGFYALNYLATPNWLGITKLEERCRPQGKLKFNSETWKQATPTSGTRFEMVDDLLASETLSNLEANQVLELLGEADSVSDQQGEKQIVYVLGNQKAYPAKSLLYPGLFANLDQWKLEIRLRNGRVYVARVFFT